MTTIEASAFEGNTTVEEIIIAEPTQTAAYADGTGLTTIGEKCKKKNML